MARHTEPKRGLARLMRLDPWVLPLTTAIVLGGSIVFWSLAALFWLAMHPAQKSVVIWMTPPGASADDTSQLTQLPITGEWEK